jgi:quercetin dioxygenase-like cupin family protein
VSNDQPLHDEVLVLDLEKERDRITEPEALGRNGRNARTLIKDGPLRVTLVALAPGGAIAEHHADGPITVQPLTGQLRFNVLGRDHDLGPGQLLSVGAGIRHAVASTEGAVFLLTLALK